MLQQKNLEISRQSNELRVVYRWRNAMAYGLLVFAFIWNGALAVFLLAGAGWAISLHLLAGLFIAHYAVSRLVNRTVITVNRQELRVTHGPVPSFSRNRTVRSSQVAQLFLKRGGTIKSGNKVTQLYALILRTAAEEDLKLLGGISDHEMGRAIEQTIEEYLDIRDVPVEERLSLDDLGILKKFIPEDVRREFTQRVQEMEVAEPVPAGSPPPIAGPSPAPERDRHLSYDFDLCHAPVWASFTLKDIPHRLAEVTRIVWTGGSDADAVRILRAVPLGPGPDRQYYAYPDGNQWAYLEERVLDSEEQASLGFDTPEAPASLRNGDERYHILSNRNGIMHGAYGERPVEQWIYFSSRASTRFRALREGGRRWTVAIQEPFDSSYIEVVE